MSELLNLIMRAKKEYYVKNNSIMTDEEFDNLVDLYKKQTGENPPVGFDIKESSLQKVKHSHPMLSLKKINDISKLKKWFSDKKRVKSRLENTFIAQAKIDGVSLSLSYSNGYLIRAVTRGDGTQGENVTDAVLNIESIPKYIKDFSFSDNIEVRGECYFSKDVFNQLKKENPEFISARNLVSGTIRLKEIEENINRIKVISFLAYKIFDDRCYTESEQIQTLKEAGFKTPLQSEILTEFNVLEGFIDFVEQKRDMLSYQIDGLVIKMNDMLAQQKLGNTSHHPKYYVSWKFKNQKKESKLLDVEWSTTSTGRINPTGIISPIYIDDVKIEKVTLNNIEWIKDKGLKINSRVIIERANDVIPFLGEIIEEGDTDIKIPKKCSCCGVKAKIRDKFIYCTNKYCEDVLTGKILNVCKILDIQGIGDVLAKKIAEKIIDELDYSDFINETKQNPNHLIFLNYSLADLKELTESEIISTKLICEIASKLYEITPAQILACFLISGIGISTAEKITNELSFYNLRNLTTFDYVMVNGVGKQLAENLQEFFRDKKNTKILDFASKFLKIRTIISKQESNTLENLTFCITGKFLTARKEIERKIKQNKGTVVSSVSYKTNYLILGVDAGSKLLQAKKFGTNLISLDDLDNLIKGVKDDN